MKMLKMQLMVHFIKKDGKRKPRKILCRMLGVKVFDLMKWNPEYKYKLQGNLIRSKGELLVVLV